MAGLYGVDAETMRRMQSQFQKSQNLSNAQNDVNTSRANLNNFVNSKSNVIDQATKDRMNKQFKISSNTQNAINQTGALLQQLSSGKTSYTDRLNGIIDTIMNRKEFSYNPDEDALWQNALASAMRNGKQAMNDTIGQAAALTGGYGSSYGTSAANQAYNQYVQSAYDNLPQYYQMAMEAYNQEGDRLNNQYSILSDADKNEYDRLLQNYSANKDYSDTLYNRDFSEWSASVDQANQYANMLMNEYNARLNGLQASYSANQSYADSMYNQEYSAWADTVSNAYNLANLENSNYWSAQDYALNQAKLAEEQRQFNASLAMQKANAKSAKASESETKTPDESMYQRALNAYVANGDDGLSKYLETIPEYNIEALYDYAKKWGRNVSGTRVSMKGRF